MISLRQPALALHSCDVPGYKYQMKTTWNMPAGATATNLIYWIGYAADRAPDLELPNVVINCHGGSGRLYVGGLSSPPIALANVGLFRKLNTKDIGTLWLIGCQVAIGSDGEKFCSELAKATGCFVVGANDDQFVEPRYYSASTPFGTIDDFEGAAYTFSPSGSKALYSIYDPDSEK